MMVIWHKRMWICIGINYFHKLEPYRAHTPRAAGSTDDVRELELHACLLTTFTYILCQVVRMSTPLVDSVDRHGQQNAVFATIMDLAKRFEDNEASFSTISTDMLYLRVAQTPRFSDLAIFVLQ